MSYNAELQSNNVDLQNIFNSIRELPKGTPADFNSTLPPPVGSVTATGSDQSITVSFEAVPTEYEQYLGDTAYIIVLKQGGVPESPDDGIVIKLNKAGVVIG